MTAERAITCPSCGGSIAVKAAGYSMTLGCQYCAALLDVAHPDVTVIAEYEGRMQVLAIPLGRRGTLFGTEWEAIGALERSDGDVEWAEYLLFNPYAGYRWLVFSEGEWQFGTMLLDRPVAEGSSARWNGSRYSRDYDPVSTSTDMVIGEFYWRVRAGDLANATTYSRGDDMLSAEWTGDEVSWTRLVALERGQVETAFGLIRPWSSPGGGFGRKGTSQSFVSSDDDDDDDEEFDGSAMLHQFERFGAAMSRTGDDLMKMLLMAVVTIFLSMAVMIGFGMTTQTVEGNMSVVVDGTERNAKIGTLTINRSFQVVSIDAKASHFDNRWIDLDYQLVNRATQQAYSAYGVVERYSGVDSDGSWTEGGYSSTVKFGAIPRGVYDVTVDAKAQSWGTSKPITPTIQSPTETNPWEINSETYRSGEETGEQIDIQFSAHAGGVMWSNLLILITMLFGAPLLLLWWRSD